MTQLRNISTNQKHCNTDFQKQIYLLWKERHLDLDINEQRLMGERYVILKHKFFPDAELEELKNKQVKIQIYSEPQIIIQIYRVSNQQ